MNTGIHLLGFESPEKILTLCFFESTGDGRISYYEIAEVTWFLL